MWNRSSAAVLLAMALIALMPAASLAQDAPQATYELTLRDGSRLYGTVERQNEEQVEFRTVGGAFITASVADITSLKEVSGGIVNGEFLPDDPNQTRLFFGPTARALPKGQVYLGTYEFMMPFVQVGVTDRFSIGGGTPLMFGFDESERPFWITPKIQVLNRGKVQAAAGVFNIFASGENAGVAYGVVSVSEPHVSVSVGAGLAYVSDGGTSPVVMVGADRRVRRNLKLLTENYVWEGGGVISGGVRFIGERLSADLALAVPLNINGFLALPIVNFVYVF